MGRFVAGRIVRLWCTGERDCTSSKLVRVGCMRLYAHRRLLATISATLSCNYIPGPNACLL